MLKLLFLLLPLTALADQAPPELKLPNQGRDCKFVESFHAGMKLNCGDAIYQRWSCPDSDWLLVGRVGSDVSHGCSPTIMIDSAVPQAKPEQ